MTADYKRTTLKMLNDARINAMRADRKATAVHATATALNDLQRLEWTQTDAERARKHHKYMEEVYQFAVETFV